MYIKLETGHNESLLIKGVDVKVLEALTSAIIIEDRYAGLDFSESNGRKPVITVLADTVLADDYKPTTQEEHDLLKEEQEVISNNREEV